MRVIMTGGGSGGHIYPALAIADKIKEMDPGSEILYIGNDIGLEKDVVPKAGYPIELVEAFWVERKNALMLGKTAVKTLEGVRQSLKIMKRFKPDAVIGTGGFVCFPVVYAGHRYGAKCYIQEQNAFPGMANKALEKYVTKVLLGFEAGSAYFRQPEKHVVTGNPCREIFFHPDRVKSREKLGLPQDAFVVFAFAGSQGAHKFTDVFSELIEKINGREDIFLVFGTGAFQYDAMVDRLKEMQVTPGENVWVKSYIDEMNEYLAAADLVVSRAGAISVTETCVTGRASVLIPSPNVPGNHHYYNAKAVADKGGAILIEETDLTSEGLLEEIERLAKDRSLVEEMEKGARAAAVPNAAEVIFRTVYKDVTGKESR